MSLTLSFKFNTLADAEDFLRHASNQVFDGANPTPTPAPVKPEAPAPVAPAAESETPKAKNRRGRPPRVPGATKAVDPAPVSPELSRALDNAKVTLDDVRAALSRVNEAKGMPVARAVLAQFGAARVSEVPMDKYADFILACEAEADAK